MIRPGMFVLYKGKVVYVGAVNGTMAKIWMIDYEYPAWPKTVPVNMLKEIRA